MGKQARLHFIQSVKPSAALVQIHPPVPFAPFLKPPVHKAPKVVQVPFYKMAVVVLPATYQYYQAQDSSPVPPCYYSANLHYMQLAKFGNGMIVGLKSLQQPLQFNIAAALIFQLSAAAYFIEIPIQVQF